MVALLAATSIAGAPFARAQQPQPQRTTEQRQSYRAAMEVADQKIADEVKAHSELMKNLEFLTTQIGRETDRIRTNAAGQRLDVEAVPGVRH